MGVNTTFIVFTQNIPWKMSCQNRVHQVNSGFEHAFSICLVNQQIISSCSCIVHRKNSGNGSEFIILLEIHDCHERGQRQTNVYYSDYKTVTGTLNTDRHPVMLL